MKRHTIALVTAPAFFLALGVTATQAATYTSIASGVWDAPTSWNVGGTAPNTFGVDSAVISGHDVTYNGVGGAAPLGGNLILANGNSITLNGGSLVQTWMPVAAPPLGTAIVVGASGLGSGVGTLNINGGGVVNTGTANALAVGVNLPTVSAMQGNGTVNINSGALQMGVVSSMAGTGLGLAVGIDAGAVGEINVGNGGAPGSAILDLETNNVRLSVGDVLAAAVGGTGTINVDTGGLYKFGTASQSFGAVGGTGNLFISGGSVMGNGAPNAGAMTFGSSGGTGTMVMTSGTMSTSGTLTFGTGANSFANLTQTSGDVAAAGVWFGRDAGEGVGIVSGGTLASSADLTVGAGAGGNGQLTVRGSGTVAGQHVVVGRDGANGVLNVRGGTAGSALYMNVGWDGGVGQVNQTAGAVTFGEWMAIGLGAGPDGSKYTMSGGTLTSTAGIEVGADRQGAMTISGTATAMLGGLTIGNRVNSNGTLTMTGGTTTVSGDTNIGGSQGPGTGVANVSGGTLNTGRLRVGASGGVGTLNYTGGSINAGELLISSNRGMGGNEDIGSTGTVNVSGATLRSGGWAEIGRGAGGTGTLNVTGATSQWTHAGGDVQIGLNGGMGTVNVTDGGKVTHNWWINLARGAGSTGKLKVEGAGSDVTTTDGRIVVGEDGNGTLDVLAGGSVNHNSGDRFMVGKNTGAVGVANISGAGSSFTKQGGEVWIGSDDDGGDLGVGTLNVTDGATFTHRSGGAFLVGNNGQGTVNVSNGATLTRDMMGANSGDILIGTGATGKGVMNVTNGGKVNSNWWTVISDNATSTGALNVDGAGSQFNVAPTDHRFVVGRNGVGSLTVSNGGAVNASNADMHVGMWGVGDGTVNVESGGSINGATGTSIADPGARTGMRLIVGTDATAKGTFNISSGTASFNSATIGGNGMARVSQTGGTMNVNQWTEVGQERDGGTHVPVYEISGGVLNTQSLAVGTRRDGAMNITGGVVNVGTNGTVATNYWGGTNIGHYGPTEDGGAHGKGTLNMSGGALNVTEEISVGHQSGSIGVWNLAGGTVSINVADRRIIVGRRGDGLMNITGGSIVGSTGFNIGADTAHAGNPATKGVLNIALDDPMGVVGGGDLYLGYGNRPTSGQTTGEINITQGTLRTDGWTEIGRGGAVDGATRGGKGTINVMGSTAKWEHSLGGQADVLVGYDGGDGNINITDGGTVNHNWWINVARGATSTGAIKVQGAGSTLNIINTGDARLNIGEDGNGIMNLLDGGKVTLGPSNSLTIAANATSTGTVNMVGGGTIQAAFVAIGAGAGALNIDGGKFIAVADSGNYFPGVTAANSNVGADGMTFNTNGFNVNIGTSFDGDGGITKIGNGTLTLSANQLMTGLTTVEAGTLHFANNISLAGGLTTKTGGTATGSVTVAGNLTTTGGTVVPGGVGMIGDFTVSGNVSLDPTAILRLDLMDEAAGGFDRIVNTGTFSANGAMLAINFTDTAYTFGVTEYKIITGPTDTTQWANATPVPAQDIADYGLPAGAMQVESGGVRFWLKQGSLTLVPIPESSSIALLAAVSLLGLRRRRR